LIESIDGVALGAMTPSVPVNYVETVAAQGSTITIGGAGFNVPLVNLFTSAGNLGPLTPAPGGSATQVQVVIPAGAPTGPGSVVVVNTGSDYEASNAVSLPIGAALGIDSVSQFEGVITVTGAGFSTLSVINLFNATPGGVVNLGGLAEGGAAKIPLSVTSDTQFTFTMPAEAVTGPAYVQVLNPPFIPYASTDDDPDGAFFYEALTKMPYPRPTE
jgi:hypothetical protein